MSEEWISRQKEEGQETVVTPRLVGVIYVVECEEETQGETDTRRELRAIAGDVLLHTEVECAKKATHIDTQKNSIMKLSIEKKNALSENVSNLSSTHPLQIVVGPKEREEGCNVATEDCVTRRARRNRGGVNAVHISFVHLECQDISVRPTTSNSGILSLLMHESHYDT